MICFQILKEALKYNGSESNPGNQQVCTCQVLLPDMVLLLTNSDKKALGKKSD